MNFLFSFTISRRILKQQPPAKKDRKDTVNTMEEKTEMTEKTEMNNTNEASARPRRKTMMFDLDGTMYRGTQPIEAGIRVIEFCRAHEIPYLFLTNNSMRTPQENADHMNRMGYTDIRAEDFVNSAMAAARYVKHLNQGNRAWMIGQDGMKQALLDEGFEITDDHPDFVFIGLDKTADYAKYSKALALLLDGAKLVGTNMDRILAKPGGFEVGNGSVVAMFEYATGQKSPQIAKPYAPILETALAYAGISKEDAVLIGDNLETDIALGYNNGVRTLFVESGVHHREDIERLAVIPDETVASLDEADFLRLSAIDQTIV